jgi:hypothetical protein
MGPHCGIYPVLVIAPDTGVVANAWIPDLERSLENVTISHALSKEVCNLSIFQMNPVSYITLANPTYRLVEKVQRSSLNVLPSHIGHWDSSPKANMGHDNL